MQLSQNSKLAMEFGQEIITITVKKLIYTGTAICWKGKYPRAPKQESQQLSVHSVAPAAQPEKAKDPEMTGN